MNEKSHTRKKTPFLTPLGIHETSSSSTFMLYLWETIKKKNKYNWFLLNTFKTNILKTEENVQNSLRVEIPFKKELFGETNSTHFIIINLQFVHEPCV